MSSPLKLYSHATPNGIKVHVLLELLGLKYDVQKIDIRANVQKQDWFLKRNPNCSISTIVDPNTNTTIPEFGTILPY